MNFWQNTVSDVVHWSITLNYCLAWSQKSGNSKGPSCWPAVSSDCEAVLPLLTLIRCTSSDKDICIAAQLHLLSTESFVRRQYLCRKPIPGSGDSGQPVLLDSDFQTFPMQPFFTFCLIHWIWSTPFMRDSIWIRTEDA